MKGNPIWPASPSELVLWAQLICAWLVSTYGIVRETKSITTSSLQKAYECLALLAATALVSLAALGLPPRGTSVSARLFLVVFLGSLVVSTALIRQALQRREHVLRAEFEIAVNIAAILATGGLIGISQVGGTPADPALRGGKAAAVSCLVAAIVFVFRGGTNIVRAVLDKMSANPPLTRRSSVSAPISWSAPPDPAQPPTKDQNELNRGRSIGNLERLLMIFVIGLGSYEALGFLIAAKGLIRAREFEDRNFAEYFILGSLTSTAVAMATGISLRVAVPYLWKI